MSNLNDRQRKQLLPIVLEKQGDYFCTGCSNTPAQLIKMGVSPHLYIDHINNDNDDNRKENLQFLCVSCNTKKNHPANDLGSKKTPIEYRVSKRNNARARQYVMGRMLSSNDPSWKRPEYDTLVDDMAEFLDCSQQAVKNYLAKMTSPTHGLYEWRTGQDGYNYLHFKNDADIEKAVNSNTE